MAVTAQETHGVEIDGRHLNGVALPRGFGIVGFNKAAELTWSLAVIVCGGTEHNARNHDGLHSCD